MEGRSAQARTGLSIAVSRGAPASARGGALCDVRSSTVPIHTPAVQFTESAQAFGIHPAIRPVQLRDLESGICEAGADRMVPESLPAQHRGLLRIRLGRRARRRATEGWQDLPRVAVSPHAQQGQRVLVPTGRGRPSPHRGRLWSSTSRCHRPSRAARDGAQHRGPSPPAPRRLRRWASRTLEPKEAN